MNPRMDPSYEPDQQQVLDEAAAARPSGKRKFSTLGQWVLVPLILLAGAASFMTMVSLREPPVQEVRQVYAPLVSTISTRVEDRLIEVEGNGAVTPRTRIDLIPQVGGRVQAIHPELRAGGRFSANEVLLEIEPIDYELAVTQTQSEVAAAARKLELEKAEAEAALEEWAALHPEEPAPDLVARKPQILEAEANVRAAEARARQAEINLSRTQISMPFDGRVINVGVDVGEVVPPNISVGMVYSNEVFEIPVPLEFDQLSWIHAANNGDRGSEARINVRIAGTNYQLVGDVVRIESELNEVSRLARAIVRLAREDIPAEARDRFIPGLFVDVTIEGSPLESVTSLPRAVVRDDQSVWVVRAGKLEIEKPEVVHESARSLIVRGLPDNTEVISSQLEVVAPGMDVRIREDVR